MKWKLISAFLAVSAIVIISLGMYFVRNNSHPGVSVRVRRGTIDWRISANGRTEGVSEEIRLSSKIPGRIQTISVEEGDRVKRGQILVILENDEYRARVEIERASLERAEAALRLLQEGAREEEKEQAKAAVEEARAIAENARASYARIKSLYDRGVVSKDELDRADRELKTAEAKLASASQRYKQVLAGSRPEEISAAQADVRLARGRLAEAEANYENTILRSPIDGVVLKRFMRPGESIRFEMVGMPILSLTDDSRIMVRAEIDETDVAKVKIGQEAFVTAEAYRGETFTGKVVRIGGALGRKSIFSDNPTDKKDTEILEVLIELDPTSAARLKLGLRVDVTIQIVKKENVLLVPAKAVYRRQTEHCVKLKTEKGWIEKEVKIGARDEMNVEIVEGLTEGDIVLRESSS